MERKMNNSQDYPLSRPHPWHGLEVGPNPPEVVYAFVEITPFDLVKYELDKDTGYMIVDRPQDTSSLPPALYGFIPQTYCDGGVAALMQGADRGDHDPLDIIVLSERSISRGDVLLRAHIVGGIPTLDHGHADDKIISVLEDDALWGSMTDISELPQGLITRLQHYFSTYKTQPNELSEVVVGNPYNAEHAKKVITTAIEDYRKAFS
jgi:inorganic pyrophosphatase